MNVLSHEDEQRVVDGVLQLSDLVNEGIAPTDAAVKVATRLQLEPNFIHLLGIGYNSGVVNHQRETSDGILEKLANVALVDIPEVVRQVYPDARACQTKAAAEDLAAVYDRPLEATESRWKPERPLRKQASQTTPPPVEKPEPTTAEQFFQRKKQAQQLREELRELRADLLVLDNVKFATIQEELEEYFQRVDAVSPSQVHNACRAYFPPQDQKIAQAALAGKDLTIKTAQKDTRVDWQEAPYSLLQDYVAIVKQAQDLRVKIKLAEYELAEVDPYAQPRTQRYAYKVAAAYEKFKEIDVLDDTLDKVAFIGSLGGVLAGAARVGKGDRMDSLPPALDPNFRNELNSIRAHAVLSDLIADDEVISGYDPDEVYQAYNELMPLYPHIVNNVGFMRPILRKRLSQGALDPLELSELAKVEKNFKDIEQQNIQRAET